MQALQRYVAGHVGAVSENHPSLTHPSPFIAHWKWNGAAFMSDICCCLFPHNAIFPIRGKFPSTVGVQVAGSEGGRCLDMTCCHEGEPLIDQLRRHVR